MFKIDVVYFTKRKVIMNFYKLCKRPLFDFVVATTSQPNLINTDIQDLYYN